MIFRLFVQAAQEASEGKRAAAERAQEASKVAAEHAEESEILTAACEQLSEKQAELEAAQAAFEAERARMMENFRANAERHMTELEVRDCFLDGRHAKIWSLDTSRQT